MAMISANQPVAEMHRLIDLHGVTGVMRALVGALLARRRARAPALPDILRSDVGLPPPEREMRRYWEVR